MEALWAERDAHRARVRDLEAAIRKHRADCYPGGIHGVLIRAQDSHLYKSLPEEQAQGS